MADVSNTHPDITSSRITEWNKVDACAKGEEYVKEMATTYLPKPSGFNQQQDGGTSAYNAYRARASFPEIFEPTVSSMVGMIHDKGITVELPDSMEGITGNEVPLADFHRMITRGILTFGRYGVLADAPRDGGNVFLTGYTGCNVINWDKDFFVLDETDFVRDGYEWQKESRYRVLFLDENGNYSQDLQIVAEKNKSTSEESFPRVISGVGGSRLNYVPFFVGNARQPTTEIETPPLIGVASPAIGIYQLSADYRHQLFMSGQETLVAINGEAPTAVGAGVVHQMQGGEGVTPDLKYVSPTCAGIQAHRDAMDEYRQQAAIAGARLLFPSEGGSQESGDARRLRFSSETASILTVAHVSCSILESALKSAAELEGANPDEVSVETPTNLLDKTLSAQDLKSLFEVYESDGISWETYFYNLQRGGWISDTDTPEEEFQRIDGVLNGADSA